MLSPNPNYKYICMAFVSWDSVHASLPELVPVAPMGKSVGFMLVYDSLEDLHAEYPNSDHQTIEPKPNKKGGKHVETKARRRR